jgi:hypothetical protein
MWCHCERSEAIFNSDIVGKKIATVAFGDLAMTQKAIVTQSDC